MRAVSWCRRSDAANSSLAFLFVGILSCIFSISASAGTIVRVSTTVGDYSIELMDDVAPITVQNFLNYVSRNDFNGTYLHRVVDNFVVQGGAYRFQPYHGPIDVPTDPAVPNEFNGISNVRSTVAMAKLPGEPDSATNQWFVNLADNTSLDDTNGGFTVFGTVLGEGMQILDAIDDLRTVSLGGKASDAPFVSEEYNGNPLNFVYMNVEVTQRFSGAPHVFETATGLMITSVNIDAGTDVVSMNFSTVASTSDLIIEANLESVIPRLDNLDGIATFSSADNRLRIPSLEVNQDGVPTLVTNAVFLLLDREQGRFILESYDQQCVAVYRHQCLG